MEVKIINNNMVSVKCVCGKEFMTKISRIRLEKETNLKSA
jgi:hypothetical protein